MTAGWQQPARLTPTTCPHSGVVSAAITAWRHDLGHEWHCICGKVFVVVETSVGKRLEPKR